MTTSKYLYPTPFLMGCLSIVGYPPTTVLWNCSDNSAELICTPEWREALRLRAQCFIREHNEVFLAAFEPGTLDPSNTLIIRPRVSHDANKERSCKKSPAGLEGGFHSSTHLKAVTLILFHFCETIESDIIIFVCSKKKLLIAARHFTLKRFL